MILGFVHLKSFENGLFFGREAEVLLFFHEGAVVLLVFEEFCVNLLWLSSPASQCAGESRVPAELPGPSLFPLTPRTALGTCHKAGGDTGWQEGVAVAHLCVSDVCHFSDLQVFICLGDCFVSSEAAETA